MSEATKTASPGPRASQQPRIGRAPPKHKQRADEKAFSSKMSIGVSLASAGVLGFALKDGINTGFKRIGVFTNRLSNLIAVPFSFLFPLLMLDNERASLRGESKGKDDIFSRMTYTMASLEFTPLTFGDMFLDANRSKGHMAATVLNLHNILYSFFTYTGGRLLGFLTAVKMKFNRDPSRKFRLEQEFESFYTLGNLGSAQCSIIPMASQFITGWQNIIDAFKGDFSSVGERFKKEPLSATLGTCFNSFLWPFEWISKLFDTTCRTAEVVDNISNAFPDPDNSFIPKMLRTIRDGFHSKVQNPNSGFGKFLKEGRKLSMTLATFIPPVGMVSVVWPTMNKYFRGELLNKEAQEIGGLTGLVDKVFSTAGLLGHLIYTIPYGLVVRLPQTITHATFYGTRLYNKLTGKKADPHEIRDKIFNQKPFTSISKWASKWLDKIELQLHPDDPMLINDLKDKNGKVLIKGQGRNRNIRTRTEVVVQEICMVAREKLLKEKMQEEFMDEGLGRMKKFGEKPSDKAWGRILRENKVRLKLEAQRIFKDHLAKSEMIEQYQIDHVMSKYYHGNGLNRKDRFGRERKTIAEEFDKQLNSEIDRCLHPEPTKKPKISSTNLLELLTKPKELFEVLKMKTFHLTNTFLMLWMNGFVNSADFGDKGDASWETDLWTRMFAIRELDTQQACNRELMPVACYGWQSMIDGWLLARSMPGALLGGGSLYNAWEPEHATAA